MNRKMVLGTLVGAVLLLTVIATAASAVPMFTASSLGDDEAGTVSGTGPEGDRVQAWDRTRAQNQTMLQNGSCGECCGPEEAPNGECLRQRTMLGPQEQLRNMFGEEIEGQPHQHMYRSGQP